MSFADDLLNVQRSSEVRVKLGDALVDRCLQRGEAKAAAFATAKSSVLVISIVYQITINALGSN